ncbi:MAG: PIG-L deacetylase family protein [Burkholderiaceae bacterium]
MSRPLIHGRATAESVWRPWLARNVDLGFRRAPLTPSGRLVVLAPHPDDEILACGGLLRRWRQAGEPVLLIAATDGEACHGPLPTRERARLAARRRAERRRGLARLLGSPPRPVALGLPDGGLSGHGHQLERALDRLGAPGDVVVTTWHADGHPDHEACGRAARRCCEAHGLRLLQAPVWMWHWASPAGAQVPWQAMRALPLDPATIAAKRDALRAHRSQREPSPRDGRPILGAAIVARNRRPFEYFIDESAV